MSPKGPVVYEINTWVWLQRLSRKYERRIDLSTVPDAEWDSLAQLNCDAVWLMGVWQRSLASKAIALKLEPMMAAYRQMLPGASDDDIPGSPYSVRAYTVDARLDSLAAARDQLARRGLRLVLDFVPNHVARDHAWVATHPEYFIRGTAADLKRAGEYFEANGNVIACGRDPYFPPWTDVAQLNAFSPALRKAATETLVDIARQCDGVRCDMAMLLLNDVFTKTWGMAAGSAPREEYWTEIIAAVRALRPDFLFIAEAYWDREWDLQQLGFDYCYDKRLYDRLVHGDAASLRAHLTADVAYQSRLIRFLENHDEPRAASVLPPPRHKAAAIALATLPGATLYYDGQLQGNKVQIPVQAGRGPDEECDHSIGEIYRTTLPLSHQVRSAGGQWALATAQGWPDNGSATNILAWWWDGSNGRFLIVVNFSSSASQARIPIPWEVAGKRWVLRNLAGSEEFVRDGNELQSKGLFVALEPWESYVFQVEAKSSA